MSAPPPTTADPFPLFHLSDLDFPLSQDQIPSLHPYQLALAHLNPDWDPSLSLKIKQAWRKKREKARKDITNKTPMGVFASREEQDKEGTVFARFELVDLGFEVVQGGLEGLTSAQLAAIVFHPKSTEELVEEAEEIFFNRRERDFALSLCPPSIGSAPPPTSSMTATSSSASAAPPPPPPAAPATTSRLPPLSAPPPPALPTPAPTSRLPARRAPPPPPPPVPSSSAPPATAGGSGDGGAGQDSFEPLPFGLPGLAPIGGGVVKKEESPIAAPVKKEGGTELSAEEKAKQLREREKELYRRLKEEQRRAAAGNGEGGKEESAEREREREREREKGRERDSPGRSRRERDDRERRRERSRSRDRDGHRDRDRDSRRDKDRDRERDRRRSRSRSRSRSPAAGRSSTRRDSFGAKSTSSSSIRRDDLASSSSAAMSRKRSRAADEGRSERGTSPTASVSARSDAAGGSASLRSSVRRRTNDYPPPPSSSAADGPSSSSMYPPRRDRSRSRSRSPSRRDRDRDRAQGTPPPSMPAPTDMIPLSLQDTLSVLFMRHFPADTTPSDVVQFIRDLFPPTPSRLPQHQPPVPLAIKLVNHRFNAVVSGQGPTMVVIAFVVFETREEAQSVMSLMGAGNVMGRATRMNKGLEVLASWGNVQSKSVWRFESFPSHFVESFYQRQLAAFAARKSNPHAASSSNPSGPPAPTLPLAPPAGMSDANLGPLGGSGGPGGGTGGGGKEKGPAVPQALQVGLYVLRMDNVPEEATLPMCRDFFDQCDGLLALSLSPVDFRYDYQRHVWLAFADRHLRDDARRKMAGARFPGAKMKLFYTSGEDWAAKTGEKHDWLWSEMSKEFRNKHADEYKRSMAAAGLPPSPTQTRSSVSSSAPPPASSYERDRGAAGNDMNGDVDMRDAPPPAVQQQQQAQTLPPAPSPYAVGFEPRRPGPSPAMLPQHAPHLISQEYSPNQPMLNLLPLNPTFPPRPSAAFIDSHNSAYGSYGTAWRPDGMPAPPPAATGGAGMMMPPAASVHALYPPLPMQPQQQEYPSIPPPQAFPPTGPSPVVRPLPPPSTAPTGPAGMSRAPSTASSSATATAASSGIHPARLAMMAVSGRADEAAPSLNGDSGSGGGGSGGGGEERLDAATEKKIVEETQRNAWGARKSKTPSTPAPDPTPPLPAFTPAPTSASVAPAPPSNAPTAPHSFTVKGLARSPPSGPAATLSSLSSEGPSFSSSPTKPSNGPPSTLKLSAETAAQLPSLAARLNLPPAPVVGLANGTSGSGVENGAAADGLTAGQRRKLLEKAQYEAQKKARQQQQANGAGGGSA